MFMSVMITLLPCNSIHDHEWAYYSWVNLFRNTIENELIRSPEEAALQTPAGSKKND